jgi:outer membrane protein OmpA-like peptidoglycan-associated protein/opacity protein-like surface antigen
MNPVTRKTAMNVSKLIAIVAMVSAGVAANAQNPVAYSLSEPHSEITAGFNYTGANAPPSSCQCFGMEGAFLASRVPVRNWLDANGRVTAGHASSISNLGQNLTLMTFMAGPAAVFPIRRFEPFGQILFGGARATGSYFPSGTTSHTSATSFAWAPGAGLDVGLSQRWSLRPLEIAYLHTGFPNGTNNAQRQLQIQAGVTFHLGRGAVPVAAVAPPLPPPSHPVDVVNFECDVDNPQVTVGDPVRVLGSVMTRADATEVRYTWSLNGEEKSDTTRDITISTSGLEPGKYLVEGHASLASEPLVGQTCSTGFRVVAKEEPPPPPPAPEPVPIVTRPADIAADFTQHMMDAFFDYNSSVMRPEGYEAARHDADYLKAHPSLNVIVAGYADERGADDFNRRLGMDRAASMREALVEHGIELSRIQTLTYGRAKAFCTARNEECFQQNRRAQVLLDR